jgi:hypothetical protein
MFHILSQDSYLNMDSEKQCYVYLLKVETFLLIVLNSFCRSFVKVAIRFVLMFDNTKTYFFA